jgi:hypothetical protein
MSSYCDRLEDALKRTPYALATRDASRCGGKVHSRLPIVIENSSRNGWREPVETLTLRMYLNDSVVCSFTVELSSHGPPRDYLIHNAIRHLFEMALSKPTDGESKEEFSEDLFVDPKTVNIGVAP